MSSLRKHYEKIHVQSILLHTIQLIFYVSIHPSVSTATLHVECHINATVYSLIRCYVCLYADILFDSILASMDRIRATASNACARQRSTRPFAYLSLRTGALFWTLFHILTLIASTVRQIGLKPLSFLLSTRHLSHFHDSCSIRFCLWELSRVATYHAKLLQECRANTD